MSEANGDSGLPELPDAWGWKAVETLADRGGVFTDGDWILSEDLKSGTDVRLLQLGDVGVGVFLDKSSKWISQQRFDEIGCTQLETGDLLISRMAEPIARACVLPSLPYPAITAVDVSILRIRAGAGVNRRWLMHTFNSAVVRVQVEREASGTTRKRITRTKLGRVMVPVPPIDEQDDIVGTLSEIERQLHRGDEALATASNAMRALVRAFYRDLGFGLQDLPEGWQRKRLSEIAECKLGKMLDAQKNEGVERPYLRNISVQWGHFDLRDLKEMRIKDSETQRFEVRRGDLMMCEGGEPGRCAIWDRDERIFFQKALHRIRPTEAVSATYLQRYIAFAAQAGSLERHLTGTTIKHLPGNKLAAIDIPLPPVAEQREIVRRASELDEQLAPITEAVAVARRQRERLLRAALNAAVLGRLKTSITANRAAEKSATDVA